MQKLQRAQKVGGRFVNPVPTSLAGFSTLLKLLPLYLANKDERTPKRQLGPFFTDPKIYDTEPTSGLRVTWIGHSIMLVEIDGVRVLIDPVWDPRAGPVRWAGPKRFFAAPLKLEDLPRLDVILISHNHYDHLGAGTVRRLARLSSTADAQWLTTLGVGNILQRLGVSQERITELDWTESQRIGALEITALPARHFSARGFFDRYKTLWASFVLAGSDHRVYYGADSGEWEGFEEIGRTFGPFDLTMLEIGAFNSLWKDIHMGPDGAIKTFRLMGGKGLMMPIHWGLFDLALHAWRQPIQRIFEIDDLKIWTPEPGVPTEVVRGLEVRSEWWK
jgi:L-ascorbate metabolism protein UlaG (beta-lactamase superfamily)